MNVYKLSKIISIVSVCCLFFISCKKDRYIFTMKCIKLNNFESSKYPSQNLSIKVVYTQNSDMVLGKTGSYPSNFTLPVTFAIHPPPKIHLYKEHISVQLWGDSTGLIASSNIDMKEYKIIYPIDMETQNDSVSFSVLGTWE
jgi:hypothetical protein